MNMSTTDCSYSNMPNIWNLSYINLSLPKIILDLFMVVPDKTVYCEIIYFCGVKIHTDKQRNW